MQQYREIKARHPDTILFFRMGDFYEMFEDDAQLAARELGLTLTSRNNGGAAEVPSRVPVKAATEYLRRLIGLGHRVAICEQVEDPKLAKGLVRRAVVETVTPVPSSPTTGSSAAGTISCWRWTLGAHPPGWRHSTSRPASCCSRPWRRRTSRRRSLATTPGSGASRRHTAAVPLPGAVRTEREAWEFDPALAREDLRAPSAWLPSMGWHRAGRRSGPGRRGGAAPLRTGAQTGRPAAPRPPPHAAARGALHRRDDAGQSRRRQQVAAPQHAGAGEVRQASRFELPCVAEQRPTAPRAGPSPGSMPSPSREAMRKVRARSSRASAGSNSRPHAPCARRREVGRRRVCRREAPLPGVRSERAPPRGPPAPRSRAAARRS